MSATKSTAEATATSNGRVLIIVYEMGCETSLGALTKRAVTFDDRPGISETYCALKSSVMPSSSVTTYRNVSPQAYSNANRKAKQQGAYHRMDDNAARRTNISFQTRKTQTHTTYYAFSLRASATYTLMASSAI